MKIFHNKILTSLTKQEIEKILAEVSGAYVWKITENEDNTYITILNELYYNLGILDTKKYSKNELIEKKKEISRLDNSIPLFDIFSKNIYLINSSNLEI